MKKFWMLFVGFLLSLGCIAGSKDFESGVAKFPVKARMRADFSFTAQITEGLSVEQNPAFRDLLTLAACGSHFLPVSMRFPQVSVRFYAEEEKPLKEIWVTHGTITLYSNQRKFYRYSAIVPDGAVAAELLLRRMRKENQVKISKVKMTLADPFHSASRTTNPTFDYGLYNSSGYSFMGSARWRMTPEGENWFDLAQGSCYPDPFPVRGGEKLELRFRGDSPTWLHGYICFYSKWDEVGNLNMNKKMFILDVHNKRHHPERVERFDVPQYATWARVYFQPTGEIRDFRVTALENE